MMPTFAEPVYFWMLLALLPLLLLRLRAHRLSRQGTPGLVAQRLRGQLIIGTQPWLRWLSFCLYCLALACIITALARPQWGHEEVATESEGRNILIAMDTSRSMLATDLLPDRLTRAKLAAQDIVEALPSDRIGLIAFAGRPFLQAPLTMDHMAISETLNQIDTEIIPRGGTNINAAVAMAIETFQKADSKDNALILFSDGEGLEGAEELAKIGKDAEELGLVVIAIGVGTEAGSIIPSPNASGPGEFIKTEQGKLVRSRLDPAALQQLSAKTSRGLYLNLGATNSITDLVSEALQQIEVSRHEEALKKRPIERFIWSLSFALILISLAFLMPTSLRNKKHRTGPTLQTATATTGKTLTGLLLLAILTFAGNSTAQEKEPVAALHAYQKEDYKNALHAYQQELAQSESTKEQSRLHFGLGASAYRTGDLELAEQSFGKVLEQAHSKKLTTDAHYNLGNTLFRHGQALLKPKATTVEESGDTPPSKTAQPDLKGAGRQWQSALEHYQAAIDIDPQHQAAEENLKIVRKHLKQLQEQQKQQQEQKDKEDKEDKKNKEDQKKEQKDKDQKPDKESKDGKPKDGSQDPNGKPTDPKDPNKKNEQKGGKKTQQPPSGNDPSGEPKKPSDQKQDGKGQPKNQKDKQQKDGKKLKPQQKGQAEPQEKDLDGNLKANPNQQQPAQSASPQEKKEMQQRNPQTGFSPLEARRLLQNLSDEDLTVKPQIRPAPAQAYKNW